MVKTTLSWKQSLFFGVALLVVVADQLTKYLVRAYLTFGESFPQNGFIRLTHVTNTGTAFGLFQGQAALLLWAGLVAVALVMVMVFSRSPTFGHWWARLALGLELGGGVGNLIDRLRWGEVVDFVDLGAWPVFNVADASITMGLVVLVASMFFSSHKPGSP